MEEEKHVAELRRQIDELREAVRARDEFISIAAHELRNPMSPILMQVEMLRHAAERGDDRERLAAGLTRLESLVHRYVSRATTLLDVSRISAGKLLLAPSEVDLPDLVRRVAKPLARMAERSGSRMELALPDSVTGVWDPLAVEQVVENLVTNAIKFGAAQPIDVALAVSEDEQSVVLTVRDRGVGISPEDRTRLFDRFEQTATGRSQGGFGVGLWLVGRLVAAMGGSIEVESAPGTGSTFAVTLPRGGTGAEGALAT
jgi:two-component system, OmpR family, sensor kinase